VVRLKDQLVDAEASQREFIDLEQQLAESERARAAAMAGKVEAERRLEALVQEGDASTAARLREAEAAAAAAAQSAEEAAAAAAEERAGLSAAVQRLERVRCDI